ncbi:MAG: hypothetical protein HYR83_13775 [Planctomycetes bacterium]|nr:hypothetical protein [Planctomycetota bacterium]
MHPSKPDGSACGSPANTDCDNPDTCNKGVCAPNFEPSGTPCTDDGNECTNDACNGSGSCMHPSKPDGSACGSPANTDCDNPDTCNKGVCVPNFEPNGTPCTDDGKICTEDACDGEGNCTHDALDPCPCESNVVIDKCDTGVCDQTLPDGTTMQDAIDACASNARNHGKFVSCVAHITKAWETPPMQFITSRDRAAIIRCAAKANIPLMVQAGVRPTRK